MFHSTFTILIVVVLLGNVSIFVTSTKIALFPSTGCYSHDVMMKQVGDQLDNETNNITWVQTLLYDFGFGEMKLPDHWNRISLVGIDENGEYLQTNTGRLIWKQNVPFDFDRPFNIQGIKDFVLMLQRHQEYCTTMLEDPRFQQLRRENVTVAVLDHFLQECMGGLAHLLNASVIQFSNWPISDGYITSLNLPALSSSVPKTGTRNSGAGMTFLERCQNLIFHVAIAFTRFVQMNTLDRLFAAKQYPWIQVEMNEAQRPIYAGRSEILLESVRPINNRVKYFGAASTLPPQNYISSSFHYEAVFSKNSPKQDFGKVTVSGHVNKNSTNPCFRFEATKIVRRPWLFNKKSVSLLEIQNRQKSLVEKFSELSWEKIHTQKFILVTFGSVAQVDKMHKELLVSLLETFAEQPEIIIWQSNLNREEMQEIHNVTVPDNVLISGWIPIKELLAHDNIQYIICHGGINTVNELALFGVPVLGVPLQGDQASNLARLVDLGSAELMTIIQLNSRLLSEKMSKMRENLPNYWRRSEKLARMLADHRQFHENYQKFWFNWVGRHGKTIESRRFFRFEYLGDMENRFWMSITGFFIGFFIILNF